MRFSGIITIVYLVVGVLVAANRNYLGDIGGLGDLINLVLAVLLWPLVLLGVDFTFGGGGRGGRRNGALFMVAALLGERLVSSARLSRKQTERGGR